MPRDGDRHPDFPGCLWNSSIDNYVCDDGFTVDGDPVGFGAQYNDGTFVAASDPQNDDDLFVNDGGGDDYVVRGTTRGQRTASATELAALIPHGGRLAVAAGSSELEIALANESQFSVERDPTDSNRYLVSVKTNWLLWAALATAAVVGISVLGGGGRQR
jgi:hypothetical protein